MEFLASPLKVIISPFKAFRDIAQNPDVKGVLLVMGILLLATAGVYYIYGSKFVWTVDSQTTTLLASNAFGTILISGLSATVFAFFTTWLIFGGALLIVARAFGQKEGSWRTFFILVGYVLSVLIIRMAAEAFLISTLPTISMSFPWPPTTQAQSDQLTELVNNMWSSALASQLGTFIFLGIEIWMVALGAIAVRAMQPIGWGKAIIISVMAYLFLFMLRFYIPFLVL